MSTTELFEIDANGALLKTQLDLPRQSGKVRDVYDLGDSLLIVSTDRISAFDWILPNGIPEKGRILTSMSNFWFDYLSVQNHLLDTEVPSCVVASAEDRAVLDGRVMVVRKAEVVPFECVIRGYLEGSGWAEYQASGAVCGVELPSGLLQASKLPAAIFTPATKAESGHDENVSEGTMADAVGADITLRLKELSLDVYNSAASYAANKGIIIADTKFEWGIVDGEVILVDEVLTPDSSRFWPAAEYEPGRAQASFDKQFVREWLAKTDWDRNSPPPQLPEEIVEKTAEKYREALNTLT